MSVPGDVRDESLLKNLFETHKPAWVLHAAAHKHVTLMEDNPQEAVKNNTLGTYILAKTAAAYKVERFLFISTDKAVRPTSVMGASKRLAEMVLRSLAGQSSTRFMSVRFGNVLGSSGSVVKIFQEQIQAGGPVTVTHKDVIRYFMTTEEAVSLVLNACAIGEGGEIFVLNMGEPVKIVDLARNMIVCPGRRCTRTCSAPAISARTPGIPIFSRRCLARPTACLPRPSCRNLSILLLTAF